MASSGLVFPGDLSAGFASSASRRDWFPRIYNWFVEAIILTGPLVVYGVAALGISMRFSRSLIVLAVPLLILRVFTRPALFVRDRFLMYGVIPYFAYTTLSVIWAQSAAPGAAGQRLGGLVEIMLVYALIVGADLTPERFHRFARIYLISAVIPLFVSVWQLLNNFYHFSGSELPFDRFVIAGHYTELENRYFITADGFSRVSATFAEPVIYSNFICSILLLSLVFHPATRRWRIGLRAFQLTALIIMVMAVSKLSLLALALGLVMIVRKKKGAVGLLVAFLAIFGSLIAVLSSYGLLTIFDRLLSESGHYNLLLETLDLMRDSNVILGQGIGSVPFGSFHRFVLSRVYESGLVGLIFVCFVTILPVRMMMLRTSSPAAEEIKVVCVGILFAVVFGLNAYDFFIHLWPWTAIGVVMSFHGAEAARTRAARRASRSIAPIAVPA